MELAQIPTRNLADYIVDRGLKEVCCGLGDGVLKLVQVVTQAQLASHECKRITGCL